MIAVIAWDWKVKFTLFTAWVFPYQALKFSVTRLPFRDPAVISA
jgi:hypothetical protein